MFICENILNCSIIVPMNGMGRDGDRVIVVATNFPNRAKQAKRKFSRVGKINFTHCDGPPIQLYKL